jgi:hypothetical protein
MEQMVAAAAEQEEVQVVGMVVMVDMVAEEQVELEEL